MMTRQQIILQTSLGNMKRNIQMSYLMLSIKRRINTLKKMVQFGVFSMAVLGVNIMRHVKEMIIGYILRSCKNKLNYYILIFNIIYFVTVIILSIFI